MSVGQLPALSPSIPQIAWTIPLSLGDSHRGYAVLGRPRPTSIVSATGRPSHWHSPPASRLAVCSRPCPARKWRSVSATGSATGSCSITDSGDVGLAEHSDKPFVVVGVLARTGTPVDRRVHVSLEAIEAIHLDWQGGAPLAGRVDSPRTRAQIRPQAESNHGRTRRAEESGRCLSRAALRQRACRRAPAGGAAGCGARPALGGGWRRRARLDCGIRDGSRGRPDVAWLRSSSPVSTRDAANSPSCDPSVPGPAKFSCCSRSRVLESRCWASCSG